VSNCTIGDLLQLTVQPQYRTIGIEECVMTLHCHARSMIFVSYERADAISY